MPTLNQLVRKGRANVKYKTSSPALNCEPAEARRVHPRLYTNTEEAELGPA